MLLLEGTQTKLSKAIDFIYNKIFVGKIFNLFKEKIINDLSSISIYSKSLSDFLDCDLSQDSFFLKVDHEFELKEERKTEYHNTNTTQEPVMLQFLDDIQFIEPRENKPGNYNIYIEKVIRSLKTIEKINFLSLIPDKTVILPENLIKKYTLVLDLDETLIHSDFDNEFDNHDEVLEFNYEDELVHIPLIIRPGVKQFLLSIRDKYNIIVFTAGKKEYADCILNYLDPENNIFQHRLYRDNCISLRNKIFIKDLRILMNIDLEKVVIIDNSIYSFANQLSNGILVTSFYNDKSDNELFNLMNYLDCLTNYNIDDLRIYNEKVFNFERIKSEIDNESELFQ